MSLKMYGLNVMLGNIVMIFVEIFCDNFGIGKIRTKLE